MILAACISRILLRRQNHAALIALDAAEKGGRLLKECEKSLGGDAKHAAASVAGASEYRQTIDAAGLSERIVLTGSY